MMETIQFYAPDRVLVLIWCAVALSSCFLVLWMSGLFGRVGALVTTAIISAGATGLWLLAGPAGLLHAIAFSPPLVIGAVIGLILWYVCDGSQLHTTLTKVLKG